MPLDLVSAADFAQRTLAVLRVQQRDARCPVDNLLRREGLGAGLLRHAPFCHIEKVRRRSRPHGQRFLPRVLRLEAVPQQGLPCFPTLPQGLETVRPLGPCLRRLAPRIFSRPRLGSRREQPLDVDGHLHAALRPPAGSRAYHPVRRYDMQAAGHPPRGSLRRANHVRRPAPKVGSRRLGPASSAERLPHLGGCRFVEAGVNKRGHAVEDRLWGITRRLAAARRRWTVVRVRPPVQRVLPAVAWPPAQLEPNAARGGFLATGCPLARLRLLPACPVRTRSDRLGPGERGEAELCPGGRAVLRCAERQRAQGLLAAHALQKP
mmetsp:Transcript_7082/g.16995  ORF Transcript_7082/g.16995 Transcript_7082/m.16995 type:complete len:321 (+) Transcript_7082:439-1401(+)